MKYVVFLSLLAVGCVDSADPERVEAVNALTGDLEAGKAVYLTNCASCHAADGSGASDDDIRGESKDDIIEITLAGGWSMPSFERLSDQEIADCTAYILTL